MSPDKLIALSVPPALTLREALLRMDETARGILLVLHADGTLARTLTDGDLRRAILNHAGDASPVGELPVAKPITAGQDTNAAGVLLLMDQHQIDHIPVLDGQGKVVDIVFRRELSQRIWLSSPHLGEEETLFV